MDTWSIQNINEKDTQLRRSNLMVSSDFQGSGVEALIKKKNHILMYPMKSIHPEDAPVTTFLEGSLAQ